MQLKRETKLNVVLLIFNLLQYLILQKIVHSYKLYATSLAHLLHSSPCCLSLDKRKLYFCFLHLSRHKMYVSISYKHSKAFELVISFSSLPFFLDANEDVSFIFTISILFQKNGNSSSRQGTNHAVHSFTNMLTICK